VLVAVNPKEESTVIRMLRKSLLVLAALAWAGMASASTITVNVINEGHVPSSTHYGVGDMIEVEVVIDTNEVLANMFYYIAFTDNLDFISQTRNTGSLPGANWTDQFAVDGTVGVAGVIASQQDVGAVGGLFSGVVVSTLTFQVIHEDDTTATLTPTFTPGGDMSGNDFVPTTNLYDLNSATVNVPEPTVLTGLVPGVAMLAGLSQLRTRRQKER
jgi:hypothetical protein